MAADVLLGATPGVDIAAAVEVYQAAERPAWEVYEAAERTAREVYEAAQRTAWEVYQAAERTALEAYEATRCTAWEVYQAARRTAREVYEAARRPAWEVYQAARRPAWEVYQAAQRTAREALAEAVSADPLAAWIVANAMDNYEAEALTVLRALPCTADALHALAATNSWCGAWGEMWSRAEADGALSGGRVLS